MTLYLDSSAVVKLVQRETETAALRRYLRRHRGLRRVTSALARVEVVRAVLPGGTEAIAKARRQLYRLHQIRLDPRVLDDAATLAADAPLRSLDAIHLASARLLGADLTAIVTYDRRMTDTAAALRIATQAPA